MALAVIIDEDHHKAKSINSVNYARTNIIPISRTVKINEVLPFRVRFTTIGIPGFGSNVPGIGLQIIEVNNYIL